MSIAYISRIYVLIVLVIINQNGIVKSERSCPVGLFGNDCMSTCHCRDDVTCDVTTGRCVIGCASGWDGPTCQRENIAFNRPTRQKSGSSRNASFAVDANMTSCASSKKDGSGWWTMTLSQNTQVHSVTLTAGQSVDIQDWKVYIGTSDNMLSMTLCTSVRVSSNIATLPCDRPVYGNHVMLVNRDGPVTLCDFKIFNCSPSWYGHDCGSKCNCVNITEACDVTSGMCASGCASGWTGKNCQTPCRNSYGPECIYQCGNCANNRQCDHVTGICKRGCKEGWTGIFCNEQCPSESFGADCYMKCGQCYGVGSCNVITGNCIHGCQAGYMGDKCLQECGSGYYGENCVTSCGHCMVGTVCDARIGVCPAGCQPGWQGAFCKEECSILFYGEGCVSECLHCMDGDCNKTSGVCSLGCQPGYDGFMCNDVCASGYYGHNCSQLCGHCISDADLGSVRASCDAFSGDCTHGCLPGYSNESQCTQVCPEGFYGRGCLKCGVCVAGAACNPFTGGCSQGCGEGFLGDLCNESEPFVEETGNQLQVFLGIMIGFVSVIMILVTLCLILIWRQETLTEMVVGGGKHRKREDASDDSEYSDIEEKEDDNLVTDNGRVMTDDTCTHEIELV